MSVPKESAREETSRSLAAWKGVFQLNHFELEAMRRDVPSAAQCGNISLSLDH